VPNPAAVARPLTALTRKDPTTGGIVQFEWSNGCGEAFQELKERLVTAPMLCPLICQNHSMSGLMLAHWVLVLCWNSRVRGILLWLLVGKLTQQKQSMHLHSWRWLL